MSDDPTGPKKWQLDNQNRAKEAFEVERAGVNQKKEAAEKLPKHEPIPKQTYEMKGPYGDDIRRSVHITQQANLQDDRKKKAALIVDDLRTRKKEKDLIKSNDKDGKSR